MSEADPLPGNVLEAQGESRTEYTSLTSTEGESELVTQIELLKPDDEDASELNKPISSDAKSEDEINQSRVSKPIEVEPETPDGDACQSQCPDDDDDDDTLSSEAFVDDIELILMPEGTEDLPEEGNSPKLVRVTELRCHADDEEEDEDDGDFRKMDASERSERDLTPNANLGENSEDEYEYDEQEQGAVGISHSISKSEIFTISFEDDDQSGYSGHGRYTQQGRLQKVHSGVQTDITALEKDFGNTPGFDFKTRKVYLGGSVKATGSGRVNQPVKKLNWKSELTLLPSKTKIGCFGYGPSYGALSRDDRDQYSSRVTKFTSQDNVLTCSSQFLKPSTLYRTRNLSRNLNQFGSSETTLILPMTETTTAESTRYRDRIHSGTLSASGTSQFKGPLPLGGIHLSNQTSYTPRTLLSSSSTTNAAKSFRSSLPDLSSGGGMLLHSSDNKRRQSQKSIRTSATTLGNSASRLRRSKKSSSDDETSSLIDESERCIRSSIDLLLSDDYLSPGFDHPYRHFGSGSFKPTGYSSARRSYSQPILTDQGYFGEPRDTHMGSPFLPRKMSDMRCSKWAKVILPNGCVSVVSVRETDEARDVLTVHTDSGCVVNLPFRKVVFAWRTKR